MKSQTRQRGMALITAVVVVLMVAIISVGVIRFAALEVSGAAAGARREALVACAEAGRQLLLSQFRRMGQKAVLLEALNLPLDAAAPPSRSQVVGGHVYQSAGIQVSQVTTLPSGSTGPTRNVADESNRLPSSFGGSPTRIVVHCIDGGDGTPMSGRQLEVEFAANLGL